MSSLPLVEALSARLVPEAAVPVENGFCVTLYAIADRFADYAALVAGALGDRVKHWVLFNEPKAFTTLGYWVGKHAPGRRDARGFLRATHTVNLAQGSAFRAMKALRPAGEIGTAIDVSPIYPASGSEEDLAAAERWHRFQNLWFIEPALRGRYPRGALDDVQLDRLLDLRAGDEERLRAPLDFVGLNHYTPMLVSHRTGSNELPGLDLHAEWGGVLARIRAPTLDGISIHPAFTTSSCAWRRCSVTCPSRSPRAARLSMPCPISRAGSTIRRASISCAVISSSCAGRSPMACRFARSITGR